MNIKFILVILFFVLIYFTCIGQTQKYYYYKGEKKVLNINKNRLVVFFENDLEFEESLKSKFSVLRELKRKNNLGIEITFKDSVEYEKIYKSLQKESKITSIENVVGDTLPIIVSNLFYVKLKDERDTMLLQQMVKMTKTELIGKVPYTHNWYVIEVTKESKSNCLDMANTFAESENFDKVEPGFVFNFSNNCVSDTRYDEQWALNDVGNNINACDAWNVTIGSSDVIVAIIDQGIDNPHSEFSTTNFTNSFDAQDRISPAQLHGDHGTHVCGIISSDHNASSIAGVAPGLSIMEVSHPLTIISTISADLAAGINWAVENGADILSNSWGDQGGAFFNDLHSQILEDAIDNAIENGRNGLGSIVVFASGNFNTVIDYPASYRPEILTVGSITSLGQRSNFSGHGNLLDVVAPGSNILSTIRDNQYDSWDGTSMAAPHVSAISGLILSRNPYLTRLQVVDLIESTTQKIGTYSYQTVAGRPNGTWNIEMGYGLIDAFAVVEACPTTSIMNRTITSNTNIIGCNITAQNIITQNFSKLTLIAENDHLIMGPFEVQLGSELELK